MIGKTRFVVSGRVQGVYFRASTRAQALRLGLAGYAKNLPDGSVEVVALGELAKLGVLADWLWQGPPAAQVSAVQATDMALSSSDQGLTDFVTL